MGARSNHLVAVYLNRADQERIRRDAKSTGRSQSNIARDYILAGFAAADALKAGVDTYTKGTKGYPLPRVKIPPAPPLPGAR